MSDSTLQISPRHQALLGDAAGGYAIARFIRVTPTKAMRVVDLVRGKSASEAVNILRFAPQAAAVPVLKTLQSAIANAVEGARRSGERLDEADLIVSKIFVDEGPTLKRFRPRAQGRAGRILKRTSHITVVVSVPESAASKGGTR